MLEKSGKFVSLKSGNHDCFYGVILFSEFKKRNCFYKFCTNFCGSESDVALTFVFTFAVCVQSLSYKSSGNSSYKISDDRYSVQSDNKKFTFYCRDKDNNSAIVPPLEVHVDVISSTAQYHRGGSVESTDNGHGKSSASHGSPTSSRSVNFATSADESSTRRSKR